MSTHLRGSLLEYYHHFYQPDRTDFARWKVPAGTGKLNGYDVLMAWPSNPNSSEIANFLKLVKLIIFKLRSELELSGGDVLSVAKRKKKVYARILKVVCIDPLRVTKFYFTFFFLWHINLHGLSNADAILEEQK